MHINQNIPLLLLAHCSSHTEQSKRTLNLKTNSSLHLDFLFLHSDCCSFGLRPFFLAFSLLSLIWKKIKESLWHNLDRLCGQSSWLQIQRSRIRFRPLPDFLSSSRSETGSTQPRMTEELFEWKSSVSVSRNSILTAVGIRCADHATSSILKILN
jgi:hypothetical protein